MAITLNAKQRTNLSSGVTKQIRKAGNIPSVVYGKNQEPVNVHVNNLELLKTLRDEGRNAIISLEIENGETLNVMLHDYQTNPVKGDVIHADFYVVDLTEEIDVSVPVRLDGDAVGARDGGVLQQPVFELQIRVKPVSIPEEIVVDVASLSIGESISVADLPKSDVYEFLDDAETTVAVVLAPDTGETAEEAGDASVEPELVGAEDKDEA